MSLLTPPPAPGLRPVGHGPAGRRIPPPNPAGALQTAIDQARTREELFLVMANRTRPIVGGQQAFVFWGQPALRMMAISDLPSVNRHSPLVQDLERVVSLLHDARELDGRRRFHLGDGWDEIAPALKDYPYPNLLWTPLGDRGARSSGGILYASAEPWRAGQSDFLASAAAAYWNRLQQLRASAGRDFRSLGLARFTTGIGGRKTLIGLGAAFLIAMFWPVNMTVSAPFRVVSRDHIVVSAPIPGVVAEVLVKPGEKVSAGQTLARFVDAEYRNELAVARREFELSEAVYRRAGQLSFDDAEGRRQLTPAMADVEIKRAKLQLAEEKAARTTLQADGAGVAIFLDAKSLIGRPFTVGERIMEIADPSQLEFEISLAVGDLIAMDRGAEVRLFPDSSPFRSHRGKLTQISYLAEPDASGRLSYRLVASPADGGAQGLGLGATGTAKVEGHHAPLAFYLFRRPVTAIRQWLGI